MSADLDAVQRFRTLVTRALGLHLSDAQDDALHGVLERRVAARQTSAARYLDELEDRRMLLDEMTALASELTVGETYFFRHVEQLRAFAQVALPARLAVIGDPGRIRVLSAGCASGEEPYSLAMLARERGLDTGPGSFRAVDVSSSALAKAARGAYSSWALRETPPALATRWFTVHGAEHRVLDAVRAMVRFDQRNLANDGDELGAPESYDVVFCRNVLMYFTAERARATVERLTSLLAPGGFLFLGHAETLRGVSSGYHLCHTHGGFYYQRKQGSTTKYTSAPVSRSADAAWVDDIREASERVRRLTESPLLEPALVATDAPDARTRGIRMALEFAHAERFSDALNALAGLETDPAGEGDLEVMLLRASLLTQIGDLARAEATCLEMLADDELHAGAHYLLALCREAAGDAEAATQHDRMAAHLDPSFAMPRLHLGMAARRGGDLAAARAELGRALELLHREDSARVLLFGGGFAREGLVALCRAQLRACGGRA